MESVCRRCNGPNIIWSAPSPLWNAVMRGGSIAGADRYGGIVCPICFAQLAQQAGVTGRLWRLTSDDVRAELETDTPSGRLWDERAWLWVEPPMPTSPEATDPEHPAPVGSWWLLPGGAYIQITGGYRNDHGEQIVTFTEHGPHGSTCHGQWGSNELAATAVRVEPGDVPDWVEVAW